MRLFLSISAVKGMRITYGDTLNAYQQSPPPTKQCYVTVDDAHHSWHKKCHGTDINPKAQVVPLGRALQGHPEAGVLWETMIVGVLEGDELGFKSTTHQRNLYIGTIDGECVLVCRQVDDFVIASKSRAAVKKLIAVINKHATTESQGLGHETPYVVSNRYNGVDIHQTRDYIKISCDTYLPRVLQTHSWEKPSLKESDHHDSVPMSADMSKKLCTLSGPAEGTREHATLAKKSGFSYHQVLGELIYAYVVCQLDIEYAITFLSCFATALAEEHCKALKDIAKYLHCTINWGII
jgi:hypothetical protein